MEKMIASSHPNTAASRDIDFLDLRDRITLETRRDIEVPPEIDDQALVAADPKSTVRIMCESGDMACKGAGNFDRMSGIATHRNGPGLHGSNPQKAVGRLVNRSDEVLRKSLRCRPGAQYIVVEVLRQRAVAADRTLDRRTRKTYASPDTLLISK